MTPARWRVALWLSATAAVLWISFRARGALVPFGVGLAVGYALLPLVERLVLAIPVRRNEAVRRGIAVFAVYLVFGGVIVLSVSLLAPVVASQVANFIQTLPERIDAASEFVSQSLDEFRRRIPESTQARIEIYLQSISESLVGTFTGWAQQSVQVVTGTLSVLFGYMVVPFWLFYMLRDRYALQRGFLRAMPPTLQDDVRHAFTMVDHVVGRYIRAQLLLGLIVGLAVGIALSVLRVQLAIGLGVWAGVTEIIPVIGPWLGAIPGLIIVAGTAPHLLVPVALVYLVVQQLENQLLVPRVQGQATDISAGMVILLLVIAGAAFGFGGLVVAVPAAAILRELFWYLDRRLRGATPHEAFAESRAAASMRTERPVPEAAAPEVAQTAPGPADPAKRP